MEAEDEEEEGRATPLSAILSVTVLLSSLILLILTFFRFDVDVVVVVDASAVGVESVFVASTLLFLPLFPLTFPVFPFRSLFSTFVPWSEFPLTATESTSSPKSGSEIFDTITLGLVGLDVFCWVV